ncbi:hypothetical protein E2C01_005345 [Portunus trituberculatus]|uniref:Uncharacterized protein n=1 Tax=Portunus trituberculatus TaxID=210409 RepID=A0A5B7CUX3_PORTR|nr:hypothetical protein [Portunus trituberculatus]
MPLAILTCLASRVFEVAEGGCAPLGFGMESKDETAVKREGIAEPQIDNTQERPTILWITKAKRTDTSASCGLDAVTAAAAIDGRRTQLMPLGVYMEGVEIEERSLTRAPLRGEDSSGNSFSTLPLCHILQDVTNYGIPAPVFRSSEELPARHVLRRHLYYNLSKCSSLLLMVGETVSVQALLVKQVSATRPER